MGEKMSILLGVIVSKIVRLQVFPPMALIGDGTKELRVNIHSR